MKENRTLEFKEKITNSFLKTVSAFANYEGGDIIFGMDDAGRIVGLDNVEEFCLTIENKINDNVKPQPNYSLSITDAGKTITLHVNPSSNKPYFYHSKAYKRNDTSTIEVDKFELKRLILAGEDKSYEELPSSDQDLSFTYLEKELKRKIGISVMSMDVLKTLELYSDREGYNNAAAILADTNDCYGIDIVRFGETISVFKKRLTLEHQSILKSYEEAVSMYRDYYQYEIVEGIYRKTVEMIPEEAFREALANAIVHREWDVHAHISISMFDDKVEIVSVGGLPNGVDEDKYLDGQLSVLRNPILANVFHRLDLIEKFGTGIRRIKEAYHDSSTKPKFKIFENSITVILPCLSDELDLSKDEMIVYETLSQSIKKSISEIMKEKDIVFGKSKVKEILKSMAEKGVVCIEGEGRGTKYRRRK